LALLSMVLIGFYDFVYSRAVRKGVSAGTMTCSQACFFVPTVTLWSYFEGTYIWTPLLLLGPVAALLLFFGIWAFMRSVSLGEASVSTPIYRISFVITALVAIIFLEAQMTIRNGIGFVLAALKIGEASVVTPIGQLSFVVSALMVTLWMGERFTKRKVAGLLLAVATIVAFLPG
jgi:uncharacterized membrane protein